MDGSRTGVPQLLKACSLTALVGTNTHIPCKYREEGAEEGCRGIKMMGMEHSWADQVGEAVLVLYPPVFVCRALGSPAARRSAEHRALPRERCQVCFHGFLQRDCFKGPFL